MKKLLDNYGLSKKLTLEMIKNWIWNDEGDSAMDAHNRFQQKWFKYFAKVKDTDELNKILQVFVDAWNYFPHKFLKGKSPDQVWQEELKKNSRFKKKGRQKMPDVIVGGRRMPWNVYESMMKEIERLQVPFRNWVEKDVLPKYERFLEKKFSHKTVQKHLDVADIFFQRVMAVGFIKFSEIRKGFIQKEFPKWWQTHVMFGSLKEREVVSSLKKLFQFIGFIYDEDIGRFGF